MKMKNKRDEHKMNKRMNNCKMETNRTKEDLNCSKHKIRIAEQLDQNLIRAPWFEMTALIRLEIVKGFAVLAVRYKFQTPAAV